MITEQIQIKIADAMEKQLKTERYESASSMGRAINLNATQISRIRKHEFTGLLNNRRWIDLAIKLNIEIDGRVQLKTAATDCYKFISEQLAFCQQNSFSGLFCDRAGIGKTHTAKIYVQKNANSILIDCSQAKTKSQLLREMANQCGLSEKGWLIHVYKRLVFHINTTPQFLIILDEFGDLYHEAFMEIKALWNATDGNCGWYCMGADGLRKKFENNLEYQKIGYAENYSRLGSMYRRVTPESETEFRNFQNNQLAAIGKVNGIEGTHNMQKFIAATNGSIRRVSIALNKVKIN